MVSRLSSVTSEPRRRRGPAGTRNVKPSKSPSLTSGKLPLPSVRGFSGDYKENVDETSSLAGKDGEEAMSTDDKEEVDELELAVQKLDALLASWEKSSYEFIEKKGESAYQVLIHLKSDFVEGSKAKVEALVAYTESHIPNVGVGATASTSIAAGIRHIEALIKSAEESHAAHVFEQALLRARSRLLKVEELPLQWIDNPYIHTGYRFCRDTRECIRSIFAVHNETCNIWTHLLGAMAMLALGLFHLPRADSWLNGSWADRIPQVVFVAAAVECLLCSVTWHTFCNISQYNVKKRLACVDYVGITILITASILTTEYSVLYCRPFAQAFYMFTTFVSGIFGVCVSVSPRFDTRQARPIRALFFCCFALAGMFAGIHAAMVRGAWEVLPYYMPVIKSLLCYGIGVIFYALLIPERWCPGTVFDLVGMSHNIWHICVLAGIYYHYQAMMSIFEKAQATVCGI